MSSSQRCVQDPAWAVGKFSSEKRPCCVSVSCRTRGTLRPAGSTREVVDLTVPTPWLADVRLLPLRVFRRATSRSIRICSRVWLLVAWRLSSRWACVACALQTKPLLRELEGSLPSLKIVVHVLDSSAVNVQVPPGPGPEAIV